MICIIAFLITIAASDPDDDKYIVIFRNYMHQDEQRHILSSVLSESDWTFYPKRRFTSAEESGDFAVIRFHENSDVAALLQSLSSHQRIKRVVPEKRFSAPPSLPREQLFLNQSSDQGSRRKLLNGNSITSRFEAEKLWQLGFNGAKVKVAVFDTGIRSDHPHFKHIVERTNWCDDNNLEDVIGHGTFVAGVIASQHGACQGFAPEAEIHTFRVFSRTQMSYTSWFLDAMNYAIRTGMDVLNLSIGGPDIHDHPFMEKVWEMSANGIVVVSAIGNDGPLWGTLNNPADQMDVIGVGGITNEHTMAPFSSRGMTVWELPHGGYGRIKPDIVVFGQNIIGSSIDGGCRSLSGTSVASPVVAGAVALLASVIPVDKRRRLVTPASVKQALVESAKRISGAGIYEQGAGKMDLFGAYQILASYKPRATVFPSNIDLTDCPYMWPHCTQPIYFSAMPILINCTIMNGMGVSGSLHAPPRWRPGLNGDLLAIEYDYPEVIWPWNGYFALSLTVTRDVPADVIADGQIEFIVISPSHEGGDEWQISHVKLQVKARVSPTPAREMRVLWDQFHNVQYPVPYIPKDNIDHKDTLDWNGDHLHTNFRSLFSHLRARGFFIEILNHDFTCFDGARYGALLMVDPEEDFFREEIDKLHSDVVEGGLGVVVFADWYNVEVMNRIKFHDDNTDQYWIPYTGGSNVPALNELLSGFGIALGDAVVGGLVTIGTHRIQMLSGSNIVRFPADGEVWTESSLYNQAAKSNTAATVAGLTKAGKGRIMIVTDSSGVDDKDHTQGLPLAEDAIKFVSTGKRDSGLSQSGLLLKSAMSSPSPLPQRPEEAKALPVRDNFRVRGQTPLCAVTGKLPPRKLAASLFHLPSSSRDPQLDLVPILKHDVPLQPALSPLTNLSEINGDRDKAQLDFLLRIHHAHNHSAEDMIEILERKNWLNREERIRAETAELSSLGKTTILLAAVGVSLLAIFLFRFRTKSRNSRHRSNQLSLV